MFVYTFENIGIIKNLKHSDSIKPKHQKRISGVKDGMFADFDYSEMKDENPPKNESLKTHQELKSLQKLPEDANFVKEMDTIEDVFEKICKRNGVEWPEEEIEKVAQESLLSGDLGIASSEVPSEDTVEIAAGDGVSSPA